MNLMFQLFFKEVKEFLKVKTYLKVIVPRSQGRRITFLFDNQRYYLKKYYLYT